MNALIESINARTDGSQWTVMTRSVRVLFWDLPRTKVFSLTNPGLSGILWWRGTNDLMMKELHDRIKLLCTESGGEYFCIQCHDYSSTGKAFWKEFLGDQYKQLRWRT